MAYISWGLFPLPLERTRERRSMKVTAERARNGSEGLPNSKIHFQKKMFSVHSERCFKRKSWANAGGLFGSSCWFLDAKRFQLCWLGPALVPPLTATCNPSLKLHLQIFNTVPDMPLTNAQLHLSRKKSSDSKPPSCSERPLTLFHAMQSAEKRESYCPGLGRCSRDGPHHLPPAQGGTLVASLYLLLSCVFLRMVCVCNLPSLIAE